MTQRSPNDDDRSRHAICIEGVYKSYGRGAGCTPVLNGVDLLVERGECVYLAGPSGSGKTTLLSILGCILSADRGRVTILDHDLAQLRTRARAILRRDRIGFVFQRFHLIHGLTAQDNVAVPLTLRGASARTSRRRALEMLAAVGLADKAKVHPKQLSAGQCQRVALARALVGDPELILADEPTASLDAVSGPEVMSLLLRLTTAQGKTAVVVTHDQRIFRFADRVLWLDSGRVLQTVQPASTQYALMETLTLQPQHAGTIF